MRCACTCQPAIRYVLNNVYRIILTALQPGAVRHDGYYYWWHSRYIPLCIDHHRSSRKTHKTSPVRAMSVLCYIYYSCVQSGIIFNIIYYAIIIRAHTTLILYMGRIPLSYFKGRSARYSIGVNIVTVTLLWFCGLDHCVYPIFWSILSTISVHYYHCTYIGILLSSSGRMWYSRWYTYTYMYPPSAVAYKWVADYCYVIIVCIKSTALE